MDKPSRLILEADRLLSRLDRATRDGMYEFIRHSRKAGTLGRSR